MAPTVTMPALGESVTEGTVTRWLKAEGDEVAVDEPLLEVSTDKVDTEIPSPVAGTLTKILVQEDDTVPVGADLAVIGGSGGGQSAPAAEQQQAEPGPSRPRRPPSPSLPRRPPSPRPPAAAGGSAPEAAPAPQPAAEAPAQQVADAPPLRPRGTGGLRRPGSRRPASDDRDAAAYVTPLVRKLAADNGIDLASVKGTGVGGRIRKQDVLGRGRGAAKAPEPAPAAPAAAAPPAALAPAAAPARRSRRSAARPRR